jgi:beta-lactamase regulating signal transducer with metallopeptidase domain
MITASTVFDAYLDVNVLLLLACAACFAIGYALRCVGLGHTVSAQLRVMRASLLAVVISPFIALGVMAVVQGGYILPDSVPNLSDFIVAKYLQGSFEMNPSALENLLSIRSQTVSAFFETHSVLGVPIIAILLAGIAAFTLRLGLSVLRLRRMIKESYAWRRFGSLHLRLSDEISVPFSTRSWHKRFVVVPSAMITQPADLRIALAHEIQHLRQNDVTWEIFLESLRPLFFWNPAFYLWKRRVEQLRELSCDRQVMMRRGYKVADYCDCLITVCQNSLKPRRLFAIDAPVVALVRVDNRLFAQRSAKLLKNRLFSLIEGKAERNPTQVFVLLALPLLALTLAASLAIQKPSDWSQDRLMLSTIINLQRIHTTNATPTFGKPQY